MKALALFSGGLDSILAVKVIQEQGIEVIPLNFVSYFFGGKNEQAEKAAAQLGVTLEYVDFSDDQFEIVKHPKSGYGKGLNPCVDCHALMIEKALSLLEKYEASFVITGEVLGQRPMSQREAAMRHISKIQTHGELLVRPLCAKLLPETYPEKAGWISRDKMFAINGRGRKEQLALAATYGITEYPAPAGGCCLTEREFARRLAVFIEDDFTQEPALFHMIRNARLFRLDYRKYLLVGRDRQENQILIKFHKEHPECHFICGGETPGPSILFYGESFSDEQINFACRLFSHYCTTKGKGEANMELDGSTFICNEDVTADEMERFHVK